ncbi:triose-phosphate isomerase [Sphingomonas arantia]|uniref:Triosephosphate isomerase n=1 Tax=Sphingomonas arantia TaxID=1460676 RepID=A0ABW4TZC2_9SPHN
MRRTLIAGNWKMNGSRAALAELAGMAAAAAEHPGVDVVVCPPATLIAAARDARSDVIIGAQDCHAAAAGPYTGCLSAAMLIEAGATLSIVGHSERRTGQHETDAEVRAKAIAVMAAGMTAIVCVGETEAQRDAGDAMPVVAAQVAGSVPDDATADRLVVAYEPLWAIGTGRVPSIADVTEMHAMIRTRLSAKLGAETAAAVRILYGGSMNAGNAAALLAVADVDGGLVGGASLTADAFVPIIRAAAALG